MCSCPLFFLPPLIFTLVAASISHFLTRHYKISMFFSNVINLLCFLCLALAVSQLSRSMKTLKFRRNIESALYMNGEAI